MNVKMLSSSGWKELKISGEISRSQSVRACQCRDWQIAGSVMSKKIYLQLFVNLISSKDDGLDVTYISLDSLDRAPTFLLLPAHQTSEPKRERGSKGVWKYVFKPSGWIYMRSEMSDDDEWNDEEEFSKRRRERVWMKK